MHSSYSPVSPHAAATGARGLDRLIAALRAPACYPHAVENVELLQTHISCILLAGDYAYKIKKPLNLGFLDFSTLGARRHYCEEEQRLNRRTAPGLYLEVIAISGSGNSPNVLKAVEAAKRAGATTVGFTGRPGGRLREMADIVVMVPSGRIEQAEDGHLILDHVIAVALREGASGRGEGETG